MKLWTILTVVLFAVLMFAFACSGALPPMPVYQPLKSPRDASQPKSRSMVRSVPVISPASEPAPTMSVTITTNVNFLGCDPLEPGCEMFFSQHVTEEQPAGAELSIYMKDRVNASGGYQLAFFGAATFARTSHFRWYQEMHKFPPARFFYSVKVYPVVPASVGAVPIERVNRELKYADAWSTPKPK